MVSNSAFGRTFFFNTKLIHSNGDGDGDCDGGGDGDGDGDGGGESTKIDFLIPRVLNPPWLEYGDTLVQHGTEIAPGWLRTWPKMVPRYPQNDSKMPPK